MVQVAKYSFLGLHEERVRMAIVTIMFQTYPFAPSVALCDRSMHLLLVSLLSKGCKYMSISLTGYNLTYFTGDNGGVWKRIVVVENPGDVDERFSGVQKSKSVAGVARRNLTDPTDIFREAGVMAGTQLSLVQNTYELI
jgi:hypothetical protein